MIEILNLSKRFGETVAVDNLSLSVPQGEFFVVLGPNAAGKTTTIKTIAGLIRPSSGHVRVAGFDVQESPLEVRRRLGLRPRLPLPLRQAHPLGILPLHRTDVSHPR